MMVGDVERVARPHNRLDAVALQEASERSRVARPRTDVHLLADLIEAQRQLRGPQGVEIRDRFAIHPYVLTMSAMAGDLMIDIMLQLAARVLIASALHRDGLFCHRLGMGWP